MEKISVKTGIPKIRAILEAGSPCPLTVTGTSMLPFLRDERDVVILTAGKRPALGDILLYLRREGTPVLHRVHGLLPDGTLILCGDNQVETEQVSPGQILGAAAFVNRGGRLIDCSSRSWQLLSRLWIRLYPLRPWLLALVRRFSS